VLRIAAMSSADPVLVWTRLAELLELSRTRSWTGPSPSTKANSSTRLSPMSLCGVAGATGLTWGVPSQDQSCRRQRRPRRIGLPPETCWPLVGGCPAVYDCK
jgi:hypothetical protein